jgi:guanine nucleotide-binding protein subunit beta-2-like 1 protein
MIISGGMDKRMILWNIKGEEKFRSEDFDGWVSSIGHITQDKASTLAVGSWDSKIRFFDSELNKVKTIDALDYGVVKIDSDDEGEFLFVGQKNGTVKIWNLAGENQQDSLKQTIEGNSDLYDLSYEPKYFHVITLATAKGLVIKEIKRSKVGITKEFNKAACLSLAWDATKTYLFAGFSDGVIRVFKYSEI